MGVMMNSAHEARDDNVMNVCERNADTTSFETAQKSEHDRTQPNIAERDRT